MLQQWLSARCVPLVATLVTEDADLTCRKNGVNFEQLIRSVWGLPASPLKSETGAASVGILEWVLPLSDAIVKFILATLECSALFVASRSSGGYARRVLRLLPLGFAV